ncbi:MAG TPA: hypothetical protein IAD11_07500 [Candidatus Stercorousia faecigallinarum]|nr:hypothetical protein [Candidatus Stercorousia faecigallinarum]
MQVTPINNNVNHQGINNKKKDKKIKAGVIAASAFGVGAALAHVAKRQGFSLSPSAIKKTPVKDWAIFGLYNKNQPGKKVLELDDPLDIIELASASVIGGVAGGAVLDDKKHLKAKFKEAVNQLLGNVLVPIACVGAASKLYGKHKEKILNFVPQIAQKGKASVVFNKALKALPASIATVASLGIGIFAGNRVSNILNEKIFHKKVKREIKGSDFAPHVDDLGMAISLMSEQSKFSSFVQRIVPLFLCVPGIEAGTHREE